MMMMMMMMMRRLSSLRVRAKPRHLPYIYIYIEDDQQINTTPTGENVKERSLFERGNSLEATRHRRKFPFVNGVPSKQSSHSPPATPPARVADVLP